MTNPITRCLGLYVVMLIIINLFLIFLFFLSQIIITAASVVLHFLLQNLFLLQILFFLPHSPSIPHKLPPHDSNLSITLLLELCYFLFILIEVFIFSVALRVLFTEFTAHFLLAPFIFIFPRVAVFPCVFDRNPSKTIRSCFGFGIRCIEKLFC